MTRVRHFNGVARRGEMPAGDRKVSGRLPQGFYRLDPGFVIMIETIPDSGRVTVSASSTSGSDSTNSGGKGARRRRRRLGILAGAFVFEAIPLLRNGYGIGGNVVVQCSQGHQFTTIWLPGASVKSLRLGPRRVQYCPVGHHWSLVHLVRESDLSKRQLRAARERRDIRIP